MKRRCHTLLIALLLAALSPAAAFAASAGNVPVTVDIPVRFEMHGGGGTICLSADDPASPMPEDSVRGRKELAVRETGRASFGEITYVRPDVYRYTVRQTASSGRDRDPSVYHVAVIAQSSGRGSLIITKEGREGKNDLFFRTGEDRERPGAPEMGAPSGSIPATGDPADLLLPWLSAVTAMALCGLIMIGRRRREEDYERDVRK